MPEKSQPQNHPLVNHDKPSKHRDMGEKLAVYQGHPMGWKFYLFVSVIFIFGVLGQICYGVWLMVYAYEQNGIGAIFVWSRPWLIASLISFTLLLIFIIFRRRMAYPLITLYNNGFSINTGFVTKMFFWHKLAGVAERWSQDHFFGQVIRDDYSATIYPKHSRPIKLGSRTENLSDLISRIKSNIYPLLGPHLLARYNAGSRLHFGPVSIEKPGMQIRTWKYFGFTKNIPWTDIDKIFIEAGTMKITRNQSNKCHKISLSKIRNYELLLHIINEGVQK